MNIIKTHIPDVLILEPKIFEDERGFFYESYNQNVFSDILAPNQSLVQDNLSYSAQNVLRGLHYQLNQPQGTLVVVHTGKILDIAVDLRAESPTFKRWAGVTLSAKHTRSLWIPEGFAHGFLVLSENATVTLKTTHFHDADSTRCIRWDDHDLNIPWPLSGPPILSKKDRHGTKLRDAEVFNPV